MVVAIGERDPLKGILKRNRSYGDELKEQVLLLNKTNGLFNSADILQRNCASNKSVTFSEPLSSIIPDAEVEPEIMNVMAMPFGALAEEARLHANALDRSPLADEKAFNLALNLVLEGYSCKEAQHAYGFHSYSHYMHKLQIAAVNGLATKHFHSGKSMDAVITLLAITDPCARSVLTTLATDFAKQNAIYNLERKAV